LKSYKDKAIKTLSVVERLNSDFVSRAIAALAIKPRYEAISKTAIERTKEILRAE
jgi:hypothetical protein